MLAIIGSAPLIQAGILSREPRDCDLLGDYDELVAFLKSVGARNITPIAEGKKIVARNATTIFECEIAWEGSSAEELLKLILSDPIESYSQIGTHKVRNANLNLLYALKMTHRFKKNSPHFLKTMRDIQTMRMHGAIIAPEHQAFYSRRYKETMDYNHPKLNQSKKDFFTDDVPYQYDHDSIHRAVALYHKPAYEFYKPDDNEVLCSKDMFFAQREDIRLAGVYEEACVLALERSQIPYPNTDPKASFDMALMKVCTSITSGWFREYGWENYDKVQEFYRVYTKMGLNYTKLFEDGLAAGIVKPHEKA